jgi:hypothetical protein
MTWTSDRCSHRRLLDREGFRIGTPVVIGIACVLIARGGGADVKVVGVTRSRREM